MEELTLELARDRARNRLAPVVLMLIGSKVCYLVACCSCWRYLPGSLRHSTSYICGAFILVRVDRVLTVWPCIDHKRSECLDNAGFVQHDVACP